MAVSSLLVGVLSRVILYYAEIIIVNETVQMAANAVTSFLLMTRLLAAVTDRRRNSLVRYKLGLRWNFESLQMEHNMLYKTNYCHLQACVGASRVRYKLKKICPDGFKLGVIRKVACEA